MSLQYAGTMTWRFRAITHGVVCWASSKPGGYADSNIYGGGSKTFAQLFPGTSLTDIRAQGFNNMRLMFDIDTYDAASSGTKATYLSTLNTNITTLIAADFSVIVCPAGFGTFNGNFWDGIEGTLFLRLKSHWSAIAASIASLNRPDMIAFELFNEPYTISQASLTPYLTAMIVAIRRFSARESIYITPTDYQDFSNTTLTSLDGTLFTQPTIGAAFHWYPIGCQAGQGNIDYHKLLAGWIFPVGSGNKTTALALIDTNGAALGASAGQITTIKNNEVTPYYDTPKNQSYLNGQMSTVATWIGTRGLTGKVICSEGGATGDSATLTLSQPAGLTYTNRKNGYGMIKTALNTQSIPGVWQQLFYPEDGGISQGMMTDNTAFTFDSGIVGAIMNGTVV